MPPRWVFLALAALPILAAPAPAQACPLDRDGSAGPTDHRFPAFRVNDTHGATVWYDMGNDPPPVTLASVRFEARDPPPAFRVEVGPVVRTAGRVNWSASVSVSLAGEANATIFPIRVHASLRCGAETLDEQDLVLSAPVAYRDDLRAIAKEVSQRTGQNSKVVFPVELHNEGNASVRVSSEVNLTEGPELAATGPPELVLPAGDRATVGVMFLTPAENGHVDFTSRYRVRFTARPDPPNASFENAVPKVVDIDLAVHVVGLYVPVPGAALAFVATGALGLARARHRL